MIKRVHNPDVLTCIANLSSDEVFTPPPVVNQMLDSLPKELWSNEKTTFLDPVSKSGVFLREITKRLINGLESKIPNLEDRVEHILHNQVFGIGITELTSLISRRSLYCSKYANGKYSIFQFDDEQGNLKYFETKHTWKNGRCIYCGVNKNYDRDIELESYAYSFIHTNNPNKFFNNMKFDVIIGNPPYQMTTGGSKAQATPLYDKFITQSIKLNPRFLTMIIPSRWYSGGFGLNDFRKKMLNDKRISHLTDYPDSSMCFPGVQIKGGVCYFLWEKDFKGDCKVKNVFSDKSSNISERPLLEKGSEVFIRYNNSVDVYRKVKKFREESFKKLVSSQKPFGLPTNFKISNHNKEITIYGNKTTGTISLNEIPINKEMIKDYKILISAGYGAGEGFPHQIINKPFIVEPNSCCTETYIVIGPFHSKEKCEKVLSYMKTKFFRFLVMMVKNSQHALKKVYSLVPIQNFDEEWTDEKLYKKYGLSEEEIEFIESMIKPIE